MKSNKALKICAIVAGAVTAVISGLMNFYYIPIIEKGPVTRCFDMNFGYNFWEAQYFLDCLTPLGKEVYLHYQLPLDFVYPAVYCVFFILLFRLLLKKHTPLILLPVLLAIADYCENVCILLMLRSETLSPALVGVSSVATIVKTVLMWLCFAAVILIAAILIHKKNKADLEKQARRQERKAARKAKRESKKAEKAVQKLAAAEEKQAEAAAQAAETEETEAETAGNEAPTAADKTDTADENEPGSDAAARGTSEPAATGTEDAAPEATEEE